MPIFVILGLLTAQIAAAGAPTEAIQGPISKVVDILKAPRFESPDKKDEQRRAIINVIEGVFDFDKIAELALAQHRRRFNDEQFKTFRKLFTDLISDNYLKKVQEEFKNEKVKYVDERIHPQKTDRALVKTEIIREKQTIPVNYIMYNKNGKWRVYDVKVEGVSLVQNYRTQYNKFLMNHKPAELIQRLEKKEAEKENE
jgi:phospholipid transport system substrate-binding protein